MVDRITLLLKTKNISASQFADEVGVQRSSVSHVLSGRNKPSLDFIQKILKKYPEINPDWLLFGKGAMNMEFNLFSEISDSIQLQEEVIDKALKRQERPMRAVPDKIETEEPVINQPPQSVSPVQHPDIEPKPSVTAPQQLNQLSQPVSQVPEQVIPPLQQVYQPSQPISQVPEQVVPPLQQVYQPPQPVNQAPEQVYQPTQPDVSVRQQINQQPLSSNQSPQQVYQPPQPSNPIPQQIAQEIPNPIPAIPATGKEIEQIMVFYKDKTFTVYKPE